MLSILPPPVSTGKKTKRQIANTKISSIKKKRKYMNTCYEY